MAFRAGNKDAKDIFVGSKPVKEVWAGNRLAWARGKNQIIELTTPGTHEVAFPAWSTVAYIVLLGGGSAGNPGDGSFGKQGRYGSGGTAKSLVAKKVTDNARIKATVGGGGIPDWTESGETKNGSPSSVLILDPSEVANITAKGGSGSVASVSSRGGQYTPWSLIDGRYYEREGMPLVVDDFGALFPQVSVPCEKGRDRWRFGQNGDEPGSDGQYSAGGAGGAGGTLGRRELGGKGGDGVVLISFWSEPPAGVYNYS